MNRKIFCAAILGAALVAAGAFVLKGNQRTGTASPASRSMSAAALADAAGSATEILQLHSAVEQGLVTAQFRGNGRETLTATLTNAGRAPLKLQAGAGQVLEAGKSVIVVVRPWTMEVGPGEKAETLLQTCAIGSTNKVADAPYQLSHAKTPKLQSFLAYVTEHLELSPGAIQTAVLALTENLPLSAVAKFTPAAGELKSRFNTDPFRVETIDILAALTALRASGVADSAIAMTIDPQLKVEAMIEPLSHAAAMQYYGISDENEWEYWKGELLAGPAATRHYALYGIARFYPDIALEMLPKWAREQQTSGVYRIAALQALADTQRLEALPLLRQLSDELGIDTEVGRAARGAAEYLDQRLNQLGVRQAAVAFRASQNLSQF